jgi:hypothetical protein
VHNATVRTTAVLAALLVTLPAAAVSAAPRSGLYGVVMRGPVTPVCRVGVPCDEPAAATTILFVRAHRAARVKTDASGRYRIRLAPGLYAVRTAHTGLGSLVEPRRVRVPRGRFAHANLFIDTGIR